MKFRKKPVVIEAFKIVLNTTDDGTTLHAPLFRWLLEVDPKDEARNWVFAPDRVEIPTLEGVMRAEIGDWIIRGVQDEFYPCKPDIFEQTYELASVPVLETPAPRHELTRDALAEAMNEAFAEFCMDTGCAPDCFQIHGPRTSSLSADFRVGNFVNFVVDVLSRDSEPVPAPRLEWREIDEGRWQAEHERNTFRIADVTALRLFPAFAIMVNEGNSMVDCPSLPAAKATVERILAVLSPPVGPQELTEEEIRELARENPGIEKFYGLDLDDEDYE